MRLRNFWWSPIRNKQKNNNNNDNDVYYCDHDNDDDDLSSISCISRHVLPTTNQQVPPPEEQQTVVATNSGDSRNEDCFENEYMATTMAPPKDAARQRLESTDNSSSFVAALPTELVLPTSATRWIRCTREARRHHHRSRVVCGMPSPLCFGGDWWNQYPPLWRAVVWVCSACIVCAVVLLLVAAAVRNENTPTSSRGDWDTSDWMWSASPPPVQSAAPTPWQPDIFVRVPSPTVDKEGAGVAGAAVPTNAPVLSLSTVPTRLPTTTKAPKKSSSKQSSSWISNTPPPPLYPTPPANKQQQRMGMMRRVTQTNMKFSPYRPT